MSADLSMVLGGAAVALFIYAAGMILAEARRGGRVLYRDEPPLLFKLLWPLILVSQDGVQRALQPATETRIRARLQKAGIDYALTPPQFVGGQLIYALLGALACAGSAGCLNGPMLGVGLLGLGLGFLYPDLWLREKIKQRRLTLLKTLPFFLDIVTLSVEGGLNLAGAIHQAVAKTPPGPLTMEMSQVLREVRAGRARVEALRDMAERVDFPPLSSLVSAIVQGELMGSSLGPILRAQSDQRRTERFQRAEKMAMEAPVKMLGPLLLFIFPCTFIVIGFPIVVRLLSSGI